MTLTGILASVILAVLIFKGRRNLEDLILDPFGWICLSYIRFFGFADISRPSALVADFANLIGFVVFSMLYFLTRLSFKNRILQKIAASVWPIRKDLDKVDGNDCILSLSRAEIICFMIVCACWAILDIYTNMAAYGSLDAAFVRFYVSRPLTEISIVTTRIINILFTAVVAAMIALRVNGLANKSRLCKWLFFAIFVIVEIVMFPKGTVGYVFYPVFVMMFVDALLLRKRFLRSFPYKTYAIVFPIILGMGISLLVVRGGSFATSQDAIEAIDLGNWEKYEEVGTEAHSIVFEYVEEVVSTYGENKDYLFFHTPFSILVNPVPRELWPEKPYGFGKILAMDVGATEESAVSFAAGIAGEGFANGGWIGIVLLSGSVGALCGFFSKFAFVLFQSPSIAHIVLAFEAWLAAQYFVRGDMLSAWGQAVYPLVLTICSLWFIKKSSGLFRRI